MAKEADITVEYVRARINYDPETGLLMWKKKDGITHSEKVWNARFAGNQAGSLSAAGYIELAFELGAAHGRKRVRTYAHRVAWLLTYGEWPLTMVDHKDGDRTNNRVDNLREATAAENCWNTGARSWSKSGVKGVSWDKTRNKWFVSIFVHRKQIALGRYDCIHEAASAYAEAARLYHGDFANTG